MRKLVAENINEYTRQDDIDADAAIDQYLANKEVKKVRDPISEIPNTREELLDYLDELEEWVYNKGDGWDVASYKLMTKNAIDSSGNKRMWSKRLIIHMIQFIESMIDQKNKKI